MRVRTFFFSSFPIENNSNYSPIGDLLCFVYCIAFGSVVDDGDEILLQHQRIWRNSTALLPFRRLVRLNTGYSRLDGGNERFSSRFASSLVRQLFNQMSFHFQSNELK